MFTSPSTQVAPQTPSRSGTWPRYDPHPPVTPISSLTHQLSHSFTPNQQQPALDTSDTIDQEGEHTPTSPSSPLIATPYVFRNATYNDHPAAKSTSPPFNNPSSPLSMGHYPDTPSPPSAYGISGIVVNQGGMIRPVPGTATSCIRLMSGHPHDPFMAPPPPQFYANAEYHIPTAKSARPTLRATQSHNAAQPRRAMPLSSSNSAILPASATHSTSITSGSLAINEPARPATAGTIIESSSPHESAYPSHIAASAEFSTSAPSATSMKIASHSQAVHDANTTQGGSSFATGPLSSSVPSARHGFVPSSNQQPPTPSVPIDTSSIPTNPYGDDLSFQSGSYGSYDTSFSSASSGSPWTPDMGGSPHHQAYPAYYPQPGYYDMYSASKQLEPILQPGEMPAPRPPMSYAALIGEALLLAPPPHHLYVSEISESIKKRYAYYRQNPSKIYNGVRHQTSMCKAFVKLPRPFGDQSGGARKWAIRAGCESWFSGGGYHPPGSAISNPGRKQGGKAKATARSKQLAIGTASPPEKPKGVYDIPAWSPGPSSGPAFDGSGRPFYPVSQVPPYGLQPGFHYLPVSHVHGFNNPHMQHAAAASMYAPNFGYQAPPPPPMASHTPRTVPAGSYDRSRKADTPSLSSPEGHWREEKGAHDQKDATSEHGSYVSWDEPTHSPTSYNEAASRHTKSPAPAQ